MYSPSLLEEEGILNALRREGRLFGMLVGNGESRQGAGYCPPALPHKVSPLVRLEEYVEVMIHFFRLGLDDENPESWPLRDICIAWLGEDSFPFKPREQNELEPIGQRCYQKHQEG